MVKNDILYATATPNDEFFNLQTYLNVIDAPMAWDTGTGDPDVVLAILDTGVEATHEDLAGKVLAGCSTLDGFDENTRGTKTNDLNGHGSGVSGTAAAITNKGVGVAGVCWNCSILPVKVLGDNGSGSTVDVIQGILFARNYALNNPNRKVIINMSLGRSCEPPTFVPLSQAMQDAINLAWNSGLVICCCSGKQ